MVSSHRCLRLRRVRLAARRLSRLRAALREQAKGDKREPRFERGRVQIRPTQERRRGVDLPGRSGGAHSQSQRRDSVDTSAAASSSTAVHAGIFRRLFVTRLAVMGGDPM